MAPDPRTGSTLRIGLIADCQYADADALLAADDAHSRHFRLSDERLREAVASLNATELDAVVHLGDLVDRSPADVEVPLEILSQLRAPVLHVLGNHDLVACGRDETAALAMLGMAVPFSSVDIGDFRLIVLNSNEDWCIDIPEDGELARARGTELQRRLEAGEINARIWNGSVSATQRAWLDARLAEAESGGRRVILLSHHPFFPMGVHTAIDPATVLELIDRYSCVALVLSGHDHAGAFAVRRGVVHCTLEGMVESPQNAYAVAEISKEALRLIGFGRVMDRTTRLRSPGEPGRVEAASLLRD